MVNIIVMSMRIFVKVVVQTPIRQADRTCICKRKKVFPENTKPVEKHTPQPKNPNVTDGYDFPPMLRMICGDDLL